MSDASDANRIDEQVVEDVANGVQSFSDGTNSTQMLDPKARLDVADRLRRRQSANSGDLGFRSIRLRGGPGGF